MAARDESGRGADCVHGQVSWPLEDVGAYSERGVLDGLAIMGPKQNAAEADFVAPISVITTPAVVTA